MNDLDLRCKKCKSRPYLVYRMNSHNGKYFWGCPNFPICKYTVSYGSSSHNRPIGFYDEREDDPDGIFSWMEYGGF